MNMIELGFVNRIKLFEKCSKTRFSPRKRVGLGLFTVTLIYKNVLDRNHLL